jgi:signal transduction histidine kinase/predicted CoA-binding protein
MKYEFLKKLPLFADLPVEDLDRICEMVEEVHLPASAELFAEGSEGDRAYIITNGEIEILKDSGGRKVLLAVRKSGDVIGEMSLLEASPRNAGVQARSDATLLAITHEQLNHLLNTSPSAARAMLNTVTARSRTMELMLRQSEKLAQVGTLAAGIAHELNNPAAAAQRGAEQLRQALGELQEALMELGVQSLTIQQKDTLKDLEAVAKERATSPLELDALERSDAENEVETWLEERDLSESWKYAPSLVSLGFNRERLASVGEVFAGPQLPIALLWLHANYTLQNLLEEIHMGMTQISGIVKSMKTYVFLDQAPVQEVDVHEGLNNTLVMLRSKLKEKNVIAKREFADGLPHIQAYGSELNQVWTNLIDNAIDAMEVEGQLLLRTRQEGDWVIVEVEDNGPGIPEAIQSKVFSPFFTTKTVGKGTGLGLNISYNIVLKHGGDIKLYSQPGRTRFEVFLPLNFEKGGSNAPLLSALNTPDDGELRKIYETTRTIAVVGLTAQPERPSHSVPAFLQKHGFRIIPVNPNLEEALGERAYPNLKEIPEPVDVVLIFRRSEAVLPVVNEAIQIGTRVVWMQEGIINETAAETARNAGLEVVMDTCMRAEYIRLIENFKDR